MKTFIRLFALLFALIILFTAVVSCNNLSKNDDSDSTRVKRTKSTATTATSVDTVTTSATSPPSSPARPPSSEQSLESKLPAMDWDGDCFYILGRVSDQFPGYTNFEIWRKNSPGDVVGDAVWARNESLKQKYNFIVEQQLVSNTYNEIQTLYDAQDDVYDLVIYTPDKALAHATSGYLLNLYELMYIDASHVAWNLSVNDDLHINESLYFSSNYFLLQDKEMTSALVFNDELVERISDVSSESITDMTLNGKWTLETFNELSLLAQTSTSESDPQRLAVVCKSTESFASFFYGSGATLGNNVNGNIQLVLPSSAITHKIDTIGKTLFSASTVQYPKTASEDMSAVFAEKNSIFYATYIHTIKSQAMGNMSDHTYVLPFPKYDESQENYYSLVSPNTSSVFAIPYTVDDPDKIGFYLQAISEKSVNTTFDAYMDTMVRHSHDDVEKQLLWLVLSSQKFDTVASLNPAGVYMIISSQLPEFKTNIYERLYNSKKTDMETALDQYLAKFN